MISPPKPPCTARSSVALWGAVLVALVACGPRGTGRVDAGALPGDASFGTDWFDGGAGCGQVRRLSYVPRLADVLVVLDRSESMQTAFGNGTRYSEQAALLGDLIGAYQGKIRFGVQVFPDPRGCGAMGQPACCVSGPEVATDFFAADAIAGVIRASSPPTGQTPTAAALRAAGLYFAGKPVDEAARFVLLSTDGQPTCAVDGSIARDTMDPAGQRTAGPCHDALVEVNRLVQTLGVRVIVLGVGSGLELDRDGRPSCLRDLAIAGGFARGAGASSQASPFFAARDPAELEAALQTIFGAVITRPKCTIKLEESPGDRAAVAVFFDGREIVRDDARVDGWSWSAAARDEIEIFGDKCKRLERYMVERVEVRYGCPPCTNRALCE